jgi:hypothetical protein
MLHPHMAECGSMSRPRVCAVLSDNFSIYFFAFFAFFAFTFLPFPGTTAADCGEGAEEKRYRERRFPWWPGSNPF